MQQRLARQGLAAPLAADAAGVVRHLVAVQAQEHAVARWSVGMRMSGATDVDVEHALAAGAILRTHVLRPTWHFVLPEDIRWLQALTGPRVRRTLASYDRRLGLDEAVYARSSDVIERELSGGSPRTRAELAAALARAHLPSSGQALAHVVMHAELAALICSGAPRGKQHTYALVSERAPQARTLPREEALRELTLRYFASHGPATVRDFRWWSSLTAGEAKEGLALARDELTCSEYDGLTCWAAGDAAAAPVRSPVAHLLQAYDEYVVAYTESKRLLQAKDAPGRLPTGMRPLLHVLMIDGRHAGCWQRELKPREITIQLQLFGRSSKRVRQAIDGAVERYGSYMGLPASWRDVTR